jgi:hypothetical protein
MVQYTTNLRDFNGVETAENFNLTGYYLEAQWPMGAQTTALGEPAALVAGDLLQDTPRVHNALKSDTKERNSPPAL